MYKSKRYKGLILCSSVIYNTFVHIETYLCIGDFKFHKKLFCVVHVDKTLLKLS